MSRERSEVRGQQEVVKLRKWEDGKVGSRGHGAKSRGSEDGKTEGSGEQESERIGAKEN